MALEKLRILELRREIDNNTTETLLITSYSLHFREAAVVVRLTHGDISILRPGGPMRLPLVAEGQYETEPRFKQPGPTPSIVDSFGPNLCHTECLIRVYCSSQTRLSLYYLHKYMKSAPIRLFRRPVGLVLGCDSQIV